MKRFSVILALGSILFVGVSCNKNNTPAPEPIKEIEYEHSYVMFDDCDSNADGTWLPYSSMRSNGLIPIVEWDEKNEIAEVPSEEWGSSLVPIEGKNNQYVFAMVDAATNGNLIAEKAYEKAFDTQATIDNGYLHLLLKVMDPDPVFQLPPFPNYLDAAKKWVFEISSSGKAGENSLRLYLDGAKVTPDTWNKITINLKDGVETGKIDLSKINYFGISNEGLTNGGYFWMFFEGIRFSHLVPIEE